MIRNSTRRIRSGFDVRCVIAVDIIIDRITDDDRAVKFYHDDKEDEDCRSSHNPFVQF